jgi:AcrR family transcriptional regulator
VKRPGAAKKSAETRERILRVALESFRKHGYAATTMRQIAKTSGLALGAAYYYFPSKEAIVHAYYDRVQDQHARQATEALAEVRDLRARLAIAFHGKLDLVRRDRALLGALFEVVANPTHPLSIFGKQSRKVREENIAIFEQAIAVEDLPPDLRALLAPALWFLHMGFLFYFIHDGSARQQKTRKLVDGTLDLLMPLIALAKLPHAAPIRARVMALVGEVISLPLARTR